jgi:hypothetical protein
MRVLTIGVAAVALLGTVSVSASAQTTYSASAWTFVGTTGNCGIAGNKIVTSAWLNGMGLPDNGTANPGGTVEQGLLLNKDGPTTNCSSAGATIKGWTPGSVLNALGFDYRNGGHCNNGAPRINVVDTSTPPNRYFFGCYAGTKSTAPQDPANWTRVTFDAADGPYAGAEGFVFGVTPVLSIDIVFDEGTDQASPDGSEPAGIGLAVLDNIRINNTFITKKAGNPILP